MNINDYKKRKYRKNLITFNCKSCKEFIIDDITYRTKNNLYLCKNCYKKLKEGNNG